MSALFQRLSPHLFTILKAALGIGLCAWLFLKSGMSGQGFVEAGKSLLRNPLYLLSGLFPLVSTACLTLRWKLLLKSCGQECEFAYLFRLNLIGQFLAIFAPAGIAGDLVRGNYLGKGKHQVPTSRIIGTIATDRGLGLFGILMLSSLGCLYFLSGFGAGLLTPSPGLHFALILLPVMTITGLIVLFALTNHAINMWFRKMVSRFVPWFTLMNTLQEGLQCLSSASVLAKALALSLIAQFLNAAVVGSLCLLFAPAIPLFAAWFTGGMGLLGMIVPVTLNGLGTVEGIYCLLLSDLGATNCMAIGLLGRAIIYAAYSLTGYPLFVFYRNRSDDNA